MYHGYFQLVEEPFGVSPDDRFLFETPQYCEALATLYYAIQQRRGFALLVARAGLGKTSLLFRLFQMLEGQAEVVFLPDPYFDRATFLEAILVALGLDVRSSDSENRRLFFGHLTRLQHAGKTCVVVFDEAQELSRDTLEGIRMLTNFETPSEKLVHVVLAGQPRLAQMINLPEFEQLRQRLNAVARLTPLTQDEVRDYISHRLKVAGASAELFAPQALQAIACASDGVPRNVNTICFNSLTLAYAGRHRRVTYEDVAEVLWDLDLSRDGSVDLDITVPGVTPEVKAPDLVCTTPALPESGCDVKKPLTSRRVRVKYRSNWGPIVRILEQLNL